MDKNLRPYFLGRIVWMNYSMSAFGEKTNILKILRILRMLLRLSRRSLFFLALP